jgi:DNA polymerase-3 subunit gamma/tau
VPTPELPQTQAQPLDANPAAAPAESSPQPSPPSGLDRQARNLADFFNGQVLDVDDVN